MLAIGICAVALTRPNAPDLRLAPGVTPEAIKQSEAGTPAKDARKNVKRRAYGDQIQDYGSLSLNSYLTFNNYPSPTTTEEGIEVSYQEGNDNPPIFIWYDPDFTLGNQYKVGNVYTYTITMKAANADCNVSFHPSSLNVTEEGNVQYVSYFYPVSGYCTVAAGGEAVVYTYMVEVTPTTANSDYAYPSLRIDMDSEDTASVLTITDISLNVTEGIYHGWNERNFRTAKEYTPESFASLTTNIEGAKIEGNKLTLPAGFQYSDSQYVELHLPAEATIEQGYAFNYQTDITSDADILVSTYLYSTSSDMGDQSTFGFSLSSYYNTANDTIGVPCYTTGNIPHQDALVLRYKFSTTGDPLAEEAVITFEKVSCITDYIELGDLPVATWDDENKSFKFEDNGVTYQGDIYYGSEFHLKYISTEAETVDVPTNIAYDGKICKVNQLSTTESDFYVKCPNLRVINTPSLETLLFGIGIGCRLERINAHSLKDIYNTTNTEGDNKYPTVIAYSELPNESSLHYSNGGNLRVLVGQETIEAPAIPTDVLAWIPDEYGNWIGCHAGNDSGDTNWYNWSWYAKYVVGSSDEAAIPTTITMPGETQTAALTQINNSSTFTGYSPNITKLHIPVGFGQIYLNWNYCSIREIYLEGEYTGSIPWLNNRIYDDSGITVYAPSKELYSHLTGNSYWQNASIVPYGWDFELLTIDVKRKGEFAQTYIELTDADWSAGVNVKVTGQLNEQDLKNMKNMTALQSLDLSEADFDALPSGWLQSIRTLRKVILPDFVTSLPSNAFNDCNKLTEINTGNITYFGQSCMANCSSLKNIDLSAATYIDDSSFYYCNSLANAELPATLKYIGQSAFYNTAIEKAVIPEGVTAIKSGTFWNCSRLTSVTLPSTLLSIESYAFQGTALTEVVIPEGVATINSGAFSDNSSLQSITIPSTLTDIGSNMLGSCSGLQTVTCKAVIPPTATSSFLYGVDLNHCTLYVAPFAIDFYREANYWKEFYIMKPLTEPVSSIVIDRPMKFNLMSEDNAVLANNPSMLLKYQSNRDRVGQLTAEGDGTLSAGYFEMWGNLQRRDGSSSYYPATLINNAENMRADDVLISFFVEKNYWQFFTLPFDVEMANVTASEGTDFVIRRYDSAARAAMGENATGNCWVNIGADETLKAGQGYIIQAANNTITTGGSNASAFVRFRSGNTLTKNDIFRSGNYTATLGEYPAEFAHNRSWNLVGNPYPCFYDVTTLMDDFYQPITIWRGRSYQAYSPIDDRILLRPFEAFFVQSPYEAPEMTFAAEGRMHYSTAYSLQYNGSVTPGYRAPAGMSHRTVFNFNVSGMGSDDRARVVFNPEAKRTYEIERDAAKMFADEPQGIEVFVSDVLDYAICERPTEDGTVTVGVNAADEGEYTLSLEGRNAEGWTAILTDNVTGATVDITSTPYVFNAKAGMDKSRFTIRFVNATTGIDTLMDIDTEVKVFNLQGIQIYEGLYRDFKGDKGIYVIVAGEESFKIEL